MFRLSVVGSIGFTHRVRELVSHLRASSDNEENRSKYLRVYQWNNMCNACIWYAWKAIKSMLGMNVNSKGSGIFSQLQANSFACHSFEDIGQKTRLLRLRFTKTQQVARAPSSPWFPSPLWVPWGNPAGQGDAACRAGLCQSRGTQSFKLGCKPTVWALSWRKTLPLIHRTGNKSALCSGGRCLSLPGLFALQTTLKIQSRTRVVSASAHKTCRSTRDPRRMISQRPD